MALVLAEVCDAEAETRIPLKKIAGRPCVRVTVNGHPLWLILDTGSSVSVLESGASAECGLTLQSGGIVAAGMLGAETLRRTAPAALQIGPLTFPAQTWLVRQGESKKAADRALFQPAVHFNLLGMDRLAATCRWLTLDGPKGEVVFGTQSFRPVPGIASAPMAMRHGLPYVELRADSARFTCLVDTGSSVSLLLDLATAATLAGHPFRAVGGRPLGLGNQPSARTQAWRTTLPEVLLGTAALPKVDTLILDRPPALGYGALEHAAVTFDFEARRVWVRK